MKNSKGLPSLRKALTYFALVVAAFFSVWPIGIMALEGYQVDLSPLFSGKGVRQIGGVPFVSGGIFPSPVYYLHSLTVGEFPRIMANTLVIATICISLAIVAGIVAAYGLARLPIKGKGAISYMLLALRAVSPFAVVVPLYVVFTRNGLWDTYLGVALAEELVVLSVVVWMLRGFFADIPKDIYDAAAIFGATEGQIFRRVALRMVVPGIAVTALFAFILVWNEFVIADLLTGGFARTAAVGVWAGLGENTVGFKVIDFNDLNAAGFLAWLPAIAVMLGIRRYLAKGYSLGTASSRS